MNRAPDLYLDLPPAFAFLLEPATFKVAYGGRGSGKSWSIARVLVAMAYTRKLRILCVREYQSSISDSVLKLLADQIDDLGLSPWFDVQTKTIVCTLTGSEFIFKGLRRNIAEVKSTEKIGACWIEEGQSVTAESWQILIPTILRSPESQVFLSFNPVDARDPSYTRFVLDPPPGALVRKSTWRDNPAFPAKLDIERRYMMNADPAAYDWIWEGAVRTLSDAVIFKGKFTVETFDTPETARFFHGADWGFSVDPTVLVRCYITDDVLYIDQEAYGHGVEIDAIPALFDRIPTARDWPIKADSARPETISFVRREGFSISAAAKWVGSVEDGIEHLRGFRRIVIHERCPRTAEEFRLYSYKVDARNGEVLPVVADKFNHVVDSLRYALDGYIKSRGVGGIWARLAD